MQTAPSEGEKKPSFPLVMIHTHHAASTGPTKGLTMFKTFLVDYALMMRSSCSRDRLELFRPMTS